MGEFQCRDTGAEPRRARVCLGSQAKRTAGAKDWRFEAVCSGMKVNFMVQGAERVGRDGTAKEGPRKSLKTWIRSWGQ